MLARLLARSIGSVFVCMVAAMPAFAGDDVPAWLQQVATVSAPVYRKDVPAVELLREQHVTVSPDGRVTTVTNYAVRILNREGREYAFARQLYESDAGKVREMHAWLIRPSGPTKRYGKDDVIDAVEDPNDVYNESRFKMIDGSRDADTGAVFGYQTTTEERSIFSQHLWSFQYRLPTLLSRYTLTLPEAWHASSVTFNHAVVEPAVSGTTYTWELRDLFPIEPEPASPRVSSLAARVAISYFPPGDTKPVNIRTFANWTEVSRWLSELHDPQSAPDEKLAAKVHQLTADARTELDKIRAIARYVQDIRYISIDIGVSRGGGMRPHPASEVFAKSYGDCKDKANLMRAMLKVVNITAYPVGIHAADPDFVREEWASPEQFDHCIIAIKISDDTQAATVITHPKLGRLLIFDATDDNTPVGDLPEDEQGSFALIVAGDEGSLMRMPVTPPEANGLTRQIDASLDAEGSLTASVRENATGNWAVSYRSEFRHESRPAYLKIIERWVTGAAPAARVSKVEPKDNGTEGRFDLDVDFIAPGYGQLMQNRLLVFKPAVVSRRESLFLTEAKRRHPVVLESRAFTETVRMRLPAGWEVDEVPDAVRLETSFGSYRTTYEAKNGVLVFTRVMAVRATTIPADQYESVRKFYERVRAAEQAPVVLARK
jgi:hypothetical protein